MLDLTLEEFHLSDTTLWGSDSKVKVHLYIAIRHDRVLV